MPLLGYSSVSSLPIHMPPSGRLTRLAVLALLSSRPMHGYELRREAERRHMEEWANLREGSIYAALGRLRDDGAVEVVSTTREGRMPERTTYRITAEGRTLLDELMREALAVPRHAAHEVDMAFAFVNLLPPDEAERLLGQRVAALDGALGALDEALANANPPFPAAHAIAEDIIGHRRLLVEAERAWTERIRERARAGAYAHHEEAPAEAQPA